MRARALPLQFQSCPLSLFLYLSGIISGLFALSETKLKGLLAHSFLIWHSLRSSFMPHQVGGARVALARAITLKLQLLHERPLCTDTIFNSSPIVCFPQRIVPISTSTQG